MNAHYSILIVEDEPTFSRLLIHQLHQVQSFSKDITHVTTAEAAYALINEGERFDVVLLDYYLPGMSGAEFLQNLRSRKVDLAVISISISQHYRTAHEMLMHGADDYLAKEEFVNPSLIEKTIMSVLQKRAYRREINELEIKAQRLEAITTTIRTVHHELGNPLAVVKLVVNALQSRRERTEEERASLLSNLSESVDRMVTVLLKLNELGEERHDESLKGPAVYQLPNLPDSPRSTTVVS